MPEWKDAGLVYEGTYLGFCIGPARNNTMWSKALDKYKQRVDLWSHTHIGLFLSAQTYNIFSLPVLMYLGQLAEPCQEVYEAEASALTKLTSGPGTWRTMNDLWYLREAVGFPIALSMHV